MACFIYADNGLGDPWRRSDRRPDRLADEQLVAVAGPIYMHPIRGQDDRPIAISMAGGSPSTWWAGGGRNDLIRWRSDLNTRPLSAGFNILR